MSNTTHKFIVDFDDLKYTGTITKEEIELLCSYHKDFYFFNYEMMMALTLNDEVVISNPTWKNCVIMFLKNVKFNKNIEDIING